MPAGLSSNDRSRYLRDGVLFPLPMLSASEVNIYRAAASELRKAVAKNPGTIRWSALCFPWAYDLATHPGVLDVVEGLLGPEILVWGTLIVSKPARSSRFVSWHQDGAYAQLDLERSVSAWVALTESNATNGCMRVVPGSHRRGVAHRQRPNPDNLLDLGQEVEIAVDDDRAHDVILMPGEMSLHHFNTIHCSRSNRSERDRVGFVIRFTTPAMESCSFPVIQARGQDPCRHLRLAERPQENTLSEGLRLQADYEQSRSASMSITI